MRYQTPFRVLGLPLIHIATGAADPGGPPARGVACGWVAIGDLAFGPLIAVGGLALGGLAVGGLAVGHPVAQTPPTGLIPPLRSFSGRAGIAAVLSSAVQ